MERGHPACTGASGPRSGRFGAPLTPATYIVRITKSGQLPDVVGDWVRCRIATGLPADPNG